MKNTTKRVYIVLLLVAVFFCGLGFMLYTFFTDGTTWVADRGNEHIYSEGSLTVAGTIYDRNGVPLISTIDGERVHNDDEAIRRSTLHVVGDSEGYISTGIQTLYNSNLVGYNFANGIYGPGPTKFSSEHPESEPESHALAEFTREILPDIAIAYHAQGEEIFYRFNGHCPKKSAPIANLFATKTGYRLIDASGLTDCSGYKDWVIDKFDIPAFTIEVGKGENPLPLSQFPKILKDNFSAIVAL